MGCKRHRHVFHALSARFGPYSERGDVHYHPCIAGPEDDVRTVDDDCDRVLIGPGRYCDGNAKTHWMQTL